MMAGFLTFSQAQTSRLFGLSSRWILCLRTDLSMPGAPSFLAVLVKETPMFYFLARMTHELGEHMSEDVRLRPSCRFYSGYGRGSGTSRGSVSLYKTMRGRPPLAIDLARILQAIRDHGKVTSAASELDCSQAYIHAKLKEAGLTLREVLEADSLELLLDGRT